MKGKLDFLREAVKDMKTTGSITGSSRYLIKNLLKKVSFESAHLVVEFGAGNGVITTEILEYLPNNGQLLAFELNTNFCEHLQSISDKRLQVLNQDVSLLGQYVAPQSVDVIISALPLLNMPEQVKRAILSASKLALKPNGKFIQYQYSLADFSLIKEFFPNVDLDFQLLNIPPAFIYVAQN
jgi:phospholipid N-methyltransferase